MAAEMRFELLKTDLGFLECPEQMEVYLRSLLESADRFLTNRGVALKDERIEDDVLTAATAAWMYRARGAAEGADLPKNLSIQIRDRVCGKNMGGEA